jgi:ribosome-binding factor A
MSKEYGRNRRVGEQMRRILSEILRRELNDPRLQFLSITSVDVSGDLSHAKVYFSLLNPAEDPAPTQEALTRAAGFIRSQLGRNMSIRQVPALHFQHDESLERGARLTSLIDQAVASDRDKADEGD